MAIPYTGDDTLADRIGEAEEKYAESRLGHTSIEHSILNAAYVLLTKMHICARI